MDAGQQGQVLYVTVYKPTIEGLRITGGDAKGLGRDPSKLVSAPSTRFSLDPSVGGSTMEVTVHLLEPGNRPRLTRIITASPLSVRGEDV